jgi:hypothetical protein
MICILRLTSQNTCLQYLNVIVSQIFPRDYKKIDIYTILKTYVKYINKLDLENQLPYLDFWSTFGQGFFWSTLVIVVSIAIFESRCNINSIRKLIGVES